MALQEDAAGNVYDDGISAPSGFSLNSVWNAAMQGAQTFADTKVKLAQIRMAGGVALNNANVDIARLRLASTAAPSGWLNQFGLNPLPGTLGAYPQAQTKPMPGADAISFISGNPLLWAIVILVGVVMVLRYR